MMMKQAQPSTPLAYANPAVEIINHLFRSPYTLDIAIARKVVTITDGNFVATNNSGNILFKVKESNLSLRVLLDSAGNPLVTLKKKLWSVHSRWQVFRGESTESQDLIFSVKRSSKLKLKTMVLDVYLSHNTTENAPDFKIKGSWVERSCTIYAGDSPAIVAAQTHKNPTVNSSLLGKDNFMVTVYPGIDYAFIVALIVIADEINNGTEN